MRKSSNNLLEHMTDSEVEGLLAKIGDSGSGVKLEKLGRLAHGLRQHLHEGGADAHGIDGWIGRLKFPDSSYAKLVDELKKNPTKWHGDADGFVRLCETTRFEKGREAKVRRF
jgi:hypothetical protein